MKDNVNRKSGRKKLYILACVFITLIIAMICYLFISGSFNNTEKRKGNMSKETNGILHKEIVGETQAH